MRTYCIYYSYENSCYKRLINLTTSFLPVWVIAKIILLKQYLRKIRWTNSKKFFLIKAFYLSKSCIYFLGEKSCPKFSSFYAGFFLSGMDKLKEGYVRCLVPFTSRLALKYMYKKHLQREFSVDNRIWFPILTNTQSSILSIPVGSDQEPCMSTDLGSLTKAHLNLLCHIHFTPWNGSRTAHQSLCVTAHCPSLLDFSMWGLAPRIYLLLSCSKIEIPFGIIWVRNLLYGAMWPNDI